MSRRAYPQYPPTAQNFPPAPQKQAYPGQPQPHSQGQGYYGAPPNPSDGVLSGPGAPHTGAMVSQMQHMSLRQPGIFSNRVFSVIGYCMLCYVAPNFQGSKFS